MLYSRRPDEIQSDSNGGNGYFYTFWVVSVRITPVLQLPLGSMYTCIKKSLG